MDWKLGVTPDFARCYSFVISCYKLLYDDGNFGFYHCRLWQCYKRIADNYLMLEKKDEMLDNLEKATEHAIKFDMRKDGMYTAFMVNSVELSLDDAYKNYTGNDSAWLLECLRDDKYKKWKDDSRMHNIITKLETVAVM